MALTPGTRVGPYEIVAQIGAGGMGEVYRARDNRLNRDVAIKVLPDAFTRDADRLSRFKREAQVLASLNHPHIAMIYGVEETDGVRALVMELVEGETLRCPQPRATALALAKQIADALEYAHERGVIHRDLKPANIKVTADGMVKLLDFGLAKAVDDQSWLQPDATHSPTLSLGATTAGVIVGTAAYMAPEQASGKPSDRRADIWSFGAVLYEMLTGRQAFVGDSVSDTLASVLKVEPDWTKLPDDTPPGLRRLLRRCLTKDRKQRLQAIGDARIDVDEVIAARDAPTPPESRKRAWTGVLSTATVVLAAVIVGSAWYARAGRRAPERPAHFSIVSPADISVSWGGAVSPDGTYMVIPGVDSQGTIRLYRRDLDNPAFEPLLGTEGANFAFFSPDSRWVAYSDGARLKKVPREGGAPTVIAGTSTGLNCGSWSDNDTIYVCPAFGGGLSAVSANGGVPRAVTTVDSDKGELWHGFPAALPGGKAVVFVIYTVEKSFDEGKIAVVTLATGEKRILLDGAKNVQYLPSGHLVFGRNHEIFAVPFDATSLRITGEPVRVVEGAFTFASRPSPVDFSTSAAGPLLYAVSNGKEGSLLTVLDRSGVTLAQVSMKGFANSPALSPDGTRVAFQAPPDDIWVLQLESKVPTRLTFEPGEHESPVWSPDSARVAYTSSRRGIARAVFVRAADGNGPEERLFTSGAHIHLSSWSADGHYILFEQSDPVTGWDLWIYRMGELKPQVLLRGPADEQQGELSPNGRYLAYVSNESERPEVYVQPFPFTGAKWQISSGGGFLPHWSPDGRELWYRTRTQAIAVPVNTSGPFSKGAGRLIAPNGTLGFCRFARDGMACTRNEEAMARVDVMLNWLGKLPH